MGVFKHSESIWAREMQSFGTIFQDEIYIWAISQPCLVAMRPHGEETTGSIAEANLHILSASKQLPNIIMFFPQRWLYFIYHCFNIFHPRSKNHTIFHVFPCFFTSKTWPAFGPVRVLAPSVAQVLANWCAHKGYPRSKDEEEARRRRLGRGTTEKFFEKVWKKMLASMWTCRNL